MNDIAISVSSLGKRYRITAPVKRPSSRAGAVGRLLASPFRYLASTMRPATVEETLWALRDVSFDVRRGEVVGIIGRNGAGKSTLLKTLSRITEPTEGHADVYGRIGSLLEVGTGFHPELSGRENTYLNGAILGMTKREIDAKFDEIVDFSGVEKFIDTPVKRYSSGMYVRLAFAVAAHLEPEILFVDEVLAVGDVSFQRKCLGKMSDVAKAGRTVLFVSHNMGAINRLCSRALCLDDGKKSCDGPTGEVIESYLRIAETDVGARNWADDRSAPGDEDVRLSGVRIVDSNGVTSSTLDVQKCFRVEIAYSVLRDVQSLRIGFRIATSDGTVVFTATDTSDKDSRKSLRKAGRYVSSCEIPENLLNEGRYNVLNVWADVPFVKVKFFVEHVLGFDIVQTGGVSSEYPEKWSGVICPALPWTVERIG